MSAIVGLFDRTGASLESGTITRMHEQLAHRGPDGGDCMQDGPVAVGHQLLATTPQARDDQPYRDGDLVITADARLDNRAELLSQLPGSLSPASPDSHLLLEAYRQWGTACVEHLIGAFSFAIWDERQPHLFCARDHVGVKPFYYHQTDDTFGFATELKALLTLPSVPGTVEDRRIGDFLTGRLEDQTISYYERLTRLPPAHAMVVTPTSLERWQYWDLDPSKTLSCASDRAYERRFRRTFEKAVRCRLRTTGRIGSELSGGLDSSSVTVVARDLLPESEPLHTFSTIFDEADSSDEREYIDAVTDDPGIVPHMIRPDGTGVLENETEMLTYFDRPPHNTLHFSVWELARRTDEVGVTIALNGVLGDCTANYGLGLLPQLFRTARWRHLWRELQAMGDHFDTPASHIFVRHVLFPLVPDSVRCSYRTYHEKPILEAKANPALNPAFVDRIDLRERYRELAGSQSIRVASTDRLLQYQSLTSERHAANLEAIDLRYGAFGVEPRYPFADKRLLELSLAIPPSQQFRDGWTRALVRRSLADLLPDLVQHRPWKTMMDEAFWNALENDRAAFEHLLEHPGPLAQYLAIDELQATYDRFETDPSGRDARTLWRARSLAAWLEAWPSQSQTLRLEQ
ncbi:asparagine synthetase B [Natronolimnobius sp. AArcel1]|uniref:asparagine synthase-related protein n=1 Tax=Natronolimnobius sp. AArcel1 TaxID=1679093 RepID=UPI0013ED9F8B|nr:asparagine synthase-related protein [Natronolimnobius sp. AArcel1]NGM70332.1 asparagine synthetase B [Natronolimnobius sp. AArcel1]